MLNVGRELWMLAGNGVFAVPGSTRPSCHPPRVTTGRTALAPSHPSWRNLGRPTVPGRPTGRLASLVRGLYQDMGDTGEYVYG
jgi:hypothetical protein